MPGAGLVGTWPACALPQVTPSTGDSKDLFTILSNGSIVLNGSLSYNNKSAFYQLKLKACVSGGGGAQAQLGAREGLQPSLTLMAATSPHLQDLGGTYNNSFVVQCSSPRLPVHLCD